MPQPPSLSQLRRATHAEIGDVVLRHAEQFVDRWVKHATVEQSAATQVRRSELRNDLVAFLKSLGATLKAGASRSVEGTLDTAVSHGHQRWLVGWSLVELITDYQLLRLIVTDGLARELERNLTVSELESLGVAFDDAISAAAATWVDHQLGELNRANERLVDFVGILGHELRNPLNSIKLAVELIHRTSAEDYADQARTVITHGVGQLEHLVSQMLNVSRIVRGAVDVEFRPVDLRDIAKHAIHSTHALMRSKAHVLEIRQPDEPVIIEGDSARLEQVISNLLGNAARYTPPGGRIWFEIDAAGDSEVRIVVRDNGCGIAPEMLGRVFDLFSRDRSAVGSEDGLGVGLALVRTLVELHDGRVRARSDGPGNGAEFTVMLPRARGKQGEEACG
jgi:signal transduction histidine kinase